MAQWFGVGKFTTECYCKRNRSEQSLTGSHSVVPLKYRGDFFKGWIKNMGESIFPNYMGEIMPVLGWGKVFSHIIGEGDFFLSIIYLFDLFITDIIHNAWCTDIYFPFLFLMVNFGEYNLAKLNYSLFQHSMGFEGETIFL